MVGVITLLPAKPQAGHFSLIAPEGQPIEEFVVVHEYPGKEKEWPPTYYVGSVQSNALLVITTKVPLSSIPSSLAATNFFGQFSANYAETYWHATVENRNLDLEVWRNVGVPEEVDNEVIKAVEADQQRLSYYLLNIGLEHAPTHLAWTGKTLEYTNSEAKLLAKATLAVAGPQGRPVQVLVDVDNLKSPGVVYRWLLRYTYRDTNLPPTVPDTITRFSRKPDSSLKLLDRIRITRLSFARKPLGIEHFLRPSFIDTNNFERAYTYYVVSNKLVTATGQERWRRDDPRILEPMDRAKALRGFLIVSMLVLLSVGAALAWAKRKTKTEG
ncbi:MAG: hypothetical protein AAB466_02535 [Verrucomicrobiota bacterium]